MWDYRYGALAADRLEELRGTAAAEAAHGAPAVGRVRRRLGLALVHLGERLATTGPGAAAPVPAAR